MPTIAPDPSDSLSTIGLFLAERCAIEPAATVRLSDLYAAYRGWCEASGVHAPDLRRFEMGLRSRGFGSRRTRGTIDKTGLRLIES